MAKPVADIVGTGGIGVQFSDDWTWTLLPDQHDDALTQAILNNLNMLGKVGEGVPNLYDTALAGVGFVSGGEITWHGDWSDARDKAIDKWRREQGGIAGGPVP